MRKLLQNDALKSKWEFNISYTYAEVIHFWRIWPPSRFFEASQEDQAFAIVYYESKTGKEAWDAHVAHLKHQADMANLSHNREN